MERKTTKPKSKVFTMSDLKRLGKEHEEKMNACFEYDKKLGYITLKIDYPYDIDLKRIKSRADLLWWVLHLCGKPWMNTDYVEEFIIRVCRIKGWKLQ